MADQETTKTATDALRELPFDAPRQEQEAAARSAVQEGLQAAVDQEVEAAAARRKAFMEQGLPIEDQRALLEPPPEFVPVHYEVAESVMAAITDLELIDKAIESATRDDNMDWVTAWAGHRTAILDAMTSQAEHAEMLAEGHKLADTWDDRIAADKEAQESGMVGLAGQEQIAPVQRAVAEALEAAGVRSRDELAAQVEKASSAANEAVNNQWHDSPRLAEEAAHLRAQLKALDATIERVTGSFSGITDRESAIAALDDVNWRQ